MLRMVPSAPVLLCCLIGRSVGVSSFVLAAMYVGLPCFKINLLVMIVVSRLAKLN